MHKITPNSTPTGSPSAATFRGFPHIDRGPGSSPHPPPLTAFDGGRGRQPLAPWEGGDLRQGVIYQRHQGGQGGQGVPRNYHQGMFSSGAHGAGGSFSLDKEMYSGLFDGFFLHCVRKTQIIYIIL